MNDVAMNVKIPSDLKMEVKIEAAKQSITIRTFVINALNAKIAEVKDEADAKNC